MYFTDELWWRMRAVSRMSRIEDYDVGQMLGRGGFASVYRARHRSSGCVFALKVMDKAHLRQHGMEDRVRNEIKIHRKLHHEGIVQFHTCFDDDECFYIVLELCSGGNLYRYLRKHGPLSEKRASVVIKQLLLALEYMHSQGVVHRDLKLSNVLLYNDQSTDERNTNKHHDNSNNYNEDFIRVKLCDFGLAVQVEHPDEEHFTLCGTPNYIAPEIASQKSHGFPADLWSMGCLFYSIVTGAAPFEQADVKDTLKCIMAGEYEEPLGVSEEALSFMRCLINLVSDSRVRYRSH